MYRVQNRVTKEWAEVEADSAQEACAKVGWLIGQCYVYPLPGQSREIDDAVEACKRVAERYQ
jgi:hypothetical protein